MLKRASCIMRIIHGKVLDKLSIKNLLLNACLTTSTYNHACYVYRPNSLIAFNIYSLRRFFVHKESYIAILRIMISRTIHRKLFWTVLLCYISMNVAAAYIQGENGQCAQLLFRIIQGEYKFV